jgi:hypothetical protein
MDEEKKCSKCSHYGHSINLGQWWCKVEHEEMDAENCEDYDDVTKNADISIGSLTIARTSRYSSPNAPRPMSEQKAAKARRKRKNKRRK